MVHEAAPPRVAASVFGVLQFERDAVDYCRAAAGKASDPFAGQLFEMFAEMSGRRAEEIVVVAAGFESAGEFPETPSAPSEARMRQFKAEHDRITNEASITGDGAAAIRKALALRAEGREMYTRLSLSSSNPVEKEFFRRLAEEESASA